MIKSVTAKEIHLHVYVICNITYNVCNAYPPNVCVCACPCVRMCVCVYKTKNNTVLGTCYFCLGFWSPTSNVESSELDCTLSVVKLDAQIL